jgi:uncharacterized membrane protein
MLIAGGTLFFVAGPTRTALVAWLGSLLGVSLTAILALFLFPPFRLHGAIQSYAETLLYSGFESLNLERLFQLLQSFSGLQDQSLIYPLMWLQP